MSIPAIVSEAEWMDARKALLAKERALTHQRDEVCRLRRELPWVRVEKPYQFTGSDGVESLSDLFDGRDQLIVYHFMYAPGWAEGCSGCSLIADHFDGANLHVPHGGASLVVVSRAPFEELAAFKKRMGWKFKWVSSFGSDFNVDYHVSFTEESLAAGEASYNYEVLPEKKPGECPGLSVFCKDETGAVYHSYSAYARGAEEAIGAFMLLDMTPKGRNEKTTMDWVRLHDQYAGAGTGTCACESEAAKA